MIAASALLLLTLALRAELPRWAETVAAASRLDSIFFRNVQLPSGQVPVRRPPKETRAELSRLLNTAPNDAELYSLRALEAEQQLDFNAAEADWKKYVDVAADKGAARLALADYYHRRHQPQQEFDALTLAAREFAPASERLLPETQQRPWLTYQRLIQLIDDQRLDPTLGLPQFAAWIQRFPRQSLAYTNLFNYAIAHGFSTEAEQAVIAYQQAFPADTQFPVLARAQAAAKRGQTADALAIYERSYQPLWPDALLKSYFDLLRSTGGLRAYLDRARAQASANLADLNAASRLFHYWEQQGNPASAQRVLAEYRQRQTAFTSDQLLTLARLSQSVRDYDEAARNYYALYSLPGTNAATAETALSELARLLLSVPEQDIHFGSGNLSLYRDVATMDPHPGFLNGALSLLLNETDPPNRHAIQEQNAGAYFRRAQAADLVALFETRFPNSPSRPELRERAMETYATYGDSDAVIQSGARFLSDFPNAGNRTSIAMLMADAYARRNQTPQEFAQYDAVLAELSRRADNVPLGAVTGPQQAVRSPEYARVLDRYVARLVSLKRTRDALTLYRREIDRNPNDPGLYDTLAAFLEQNQLGTEVEQVYQRAIAQFQDPSWSSKLARWYLRQRRQADISRLSRDVVRIFSGTDLETYFSEIVTQAAPVGPALYLQLNLAAHQRFPHQLSFVRNLLTAYTTRGTADDLAFEVILRQSWYHAEDLRLRFYERLSRTGRLATELSLVRTSNPAATGNRWPEAADQSPAAVRMLAEGEAWRGHFEIAAPMFQALVANYPADRQMARRTAAVFRSLGASDAAATVETSLNQADPLDRATLTRLGEIHADRERFDRARAAWDKIPDIDPSKPDGYLEAATIFWDYYRYDDALRWIDTARTRLNQPDLFAYQAGAIHENRRDYARAVREYARGAVQASAQGSSAERRLLALARRPAYRADIEQLTDNLVSARNPQPGTFRLRVALFKNQNRRDDLERFLQAVATRADDPFALGMLENTARIEGFPRIEMTALDRRIAVSTDPVERMSLRLALARLYEGQGQVAQGAQLIDALYAENPAILGIVRAATDFHWRNTNTRRAVDILEQAAAKAEPGYRVQFTLEAARKATESADYPRARTLATNLLASEPFRADFIALMADTYARQRDDSGLRTFYTTKLGDLAKSNLSAAERIERTAAMRRALIPILTRLRDFTGATDQYIEVLNRYPEDGALAQEAARFAVTNNTAARLRDYYNKASTDSPKDFRWPMVLGRLETQFENYPAGIAAFTRAAAVRPDRPDLLEARINLEERLLRFDEAAATAEKLYELTYRNARWMEKLAEVRARQGRTADTVTALTKALIDGRSDNPQNYFTAAERLERWGLLAEARTFANQGRQKVPAGEVSVQGEILNARLAARQRDYNAVFTRLTALKDAAAPAVARQLGEAVAAYYTPDEKTAFATALAPQPRRIEIARAAGLADLEAQWLNAALIARPAGNQAPQLREQLIRLQTQRARFAELGTQMEALDRAIPAGVNHANELEEAASAFRSAGDTAAELRVLQRANARSWLSGPLLDRYAQLLLAQPARMIAALQAETRPDPAFDLLNYTLQHATGPVAQQAINARLLRNGPLWTKAYASLAGLHFATNTPAIRIAFTDILGDMTIGTRLGLPVNRDQKLAGDLWFYYGGRYGEYLSTLKLPGSEDYLPAMVEATPARSEAYFILAEQTNSAEDYRYALELNPARADVHDRLAVLAAQAGNTAEAVAEWKLAFQALTDQLNGARLPARFAGDVHDTLVHIGVARQQAFLRDDADRLLRLYVRRNGPFQIDTLLTGALAFANDTAAGLTWITDLAQVAPDPVQFLTLLLDRDWIPEAQLGALHQQIVASSRARLAQVFGEARLDAEGQLWNHQIAYAEYLVQRRDNTAAQQILSQLPEQARQQRRQQLVPLEIRLAARARTLPAQLARYEAPLPSDALRAAATSLREEGDAPSARRVLEFVYQKDLNSGILDAATFLGLAEIHLEEGDTTAAVALLRRMMLVTGEPFSTLDPAAALLERTGHAPEAMEFLASLTQAEPWNQTARQRLARARSSAVDLTTVARSSAAPYLARVTAAKALRRLSAAPLAGVDSELDLLSSQAALTAAAITSPYAYQARLEAAGSAANPAAQEPLLLAAVAIHPADPSPRLPLFRAALAARHDALALAIARDLLPPYMREQTLYTPYLAEGFLPQFPLADRIAVAQGIAEASQRLDDLPSALLYFQIAQQSGPVSQIRAQLDLRARNDQRRPLVTKNLEQDRLVKARIAQ